MTTAPLVGSLDTASFDANAIAIIRGFAMDAPFYAKSGHQGTAMTLAPLAHVLYSRVMNHNPVDPLWMNRDRFILSNGHASILQYANLFLNGYGLELADIKAFRQLGSLTPGHPEVGHTSGVEVTTGPLGQGFANAVGMAIAESHLRAQLGNDLVDHHTYVIVGDGCLMEGVSHEAASLAGHLKLDHLVAIFDDNKITIDGALDLTCSDNVADRFRSYQWNVIECGDISQDCDALEKVLLQARQHVGQPTLIVLPTHIGFPSPDFTDQHAAHGNPFTEEHIARTKEVIGMPNEAFWAPSDIVLQHRDHAVVRCKDAYSDWQNKSAKKSGDIAAYSNKDIVQKMSSVLPVFGNDESPATRVAIQKVLEAATKVLPQLISGAADLTGNTGAKLSGEQAYSASNPAGKQLYYGIREHAMGSIANGMALHGMVLPVVGTFFVFADYMRPSLRLAALSKAKVVFIFSHDSVGVGEDGPTHQPVEQLASLRIIPGLQVIRPCDGNETAAAWLQALAFDGPTALILSRQNLPIVTDGSAVRTGAAMIRSVDQPDLVLVGTGSEVSVCLEAAEILASRGVSASVVSAPCFSLFDSQSEEYRDKVLPHDLPIIGVEAGISSGWEKYVDDMVSIESFGTSAPGSQALEHFGISASNVADRAIQLHS